MVLSARLAAVVEALPLRPDMGVLEIGCGPGAAARAVAKRLSRPAATPQRAAVSPARWTRAGAATP